MKLYVFRISVTFAPMLFEDSQTHTNLPYVYNYVVFEMTVFGNGLSYVECNWHLAIYVEQTAPCYPEETDTCIFLYSKQVAIYDNYMYSKHKY